MAFRASSGVPPLVSTFVVYSEVVMSLRTRGALAASSVMCHACRGPSPAAPRVVSPIRGWRVPGEPLYGQYSSEVQQCPQPFS